MSFGHSADQIETALTRHYLRTDGPYGPSPLLFVDASGPELSKALGIERPEVALETFVGSFSPAVVLDVFRNGPARVERRSDDCPGYLRFLILSCAVASDSEEATDDDFRHRLAEMLRVATIGNIPGLAEAWRRLRDWCAAARRRGTFRPVRLPDPGYMSQIGYARRITFPSGSDMRRMERLFSGHAAAPSPTKVVNAVEEGLERQPWSEGFRGAYADFKTRVSKNHRLLSDHPFWTAITRIWVAPPETAGERTTIWIQTDVDGETVASIESDDPRVKTLLGVSASASGVTPESVRVEMPVMSILDVVREAKCNSVAGYLRSIEEGVLVFEESGWGWKAVRTPDTARVRLLLRREVARLNGVPHDDDPWVLTRAYLADRGMEIASTVRRGAPDEIRVASVRITDGIRVGEAYLGLACCLPRLLASPEAEVQVEAEKPTLSNLYLDRSDGSFAVFGCDTPLDGRWRLNVLENDVPVTNVTVAFVSEANEHDPVPTDATRWRDERDIASFPTSPPKGPDHDFVSKKDLGGKILELAEATYAGGEKGWAERDLLPLAMDATRSDGISPWDACRALADGGWMEPKLSNWWRERRWFLRPPRLLCFDDGTIVLDGAACASMRRRFRESVARLSGAVLCGGGGNWQLPLWAARGACPKDLEEECGIPLAPAASTFPIPPRALSFAVSGYTAVGRRVSSVWDWSAGRFRAFAEPVHGLPLLERLQHEENRSCDVYRVAQGSFSAILESRTAAILWAHQLARRALFRFDPAKSVLTRVASDGALPAGVASFLRMRQLAGPAITVTDGAPILEYPAAPGDVAAVASWLGQAVETGLPEAQSADRSLMRAVFVNRGDPRASLLPSLWAGRS